MFKQGMKYIVIDLGGVSIYTCIYIQIPSPDVYDILGSKEKGWMVIKKTHKIDSILR